MKTLLSLTITLLLSSCALEHAKDPSGASYTSARVGTDTVYRSVTNGQYSTVIHGENNSNTTKNIVSYGKTKLAIGAVKEVSSTLVDGADRLIK